MSDNPDNSFSAASHPDETITLNGERYILERTLASWGTVEVMVRNDAVSEYVSTLEAELAKLKDPAAVRINILRGDIAKPDDLVWLHDSDGPVSTLEARLEKAREVIKPFGKYMDGGLDRDNHGLPLPDEQGVGWVYLTNADFRAASAWMEQNDA